MPNPFGDNTLTFSWTPTLANFAWTVAGTAYSSAAPKTAIGTAITFTAVAVVPAGSGRTIMKYEWDFGDGVKGYGASVAHTFVLANALTRVRCTVTDNRGVQLTVGRQVYLHDDSGGAGSSLLSSPLLQTSTSLKTSA